MDPQTAYERYVDAILPASGTHELSDSELDKIGYQIMPGFYRGAFARGKEPADDGTAHFYIVNGMTGPPGDHWHGGGAAPTGMQADLSTVDGFFTVSFEDYAACTRFSGCLAAQPWSLPERFRANRTWPLGEGEGRCEPEF